MVLENLLLSNNYKVNMGPNKLFLFSRTMLELNDYVVVVQPPKELIVCRYVVNI